jgi:hypothetical protein
MEFLHLRPPRTVLSSHPVSLCLITSTRSTPVFRPLRIALEDPRLQSANLPLIIQPGTIPWAVSLRTSIPWHRKLSVHHFSLVSSLAVSHPVFSTTALGPPSIPASMHSCSPLIHALHSHLGHLLLYIPSRRSMSSTALVTLHMTYSGIQTSKKAQRSSYTELSVRTPISFFAPRLFRFTRILFHFRQL